MIDTNKEELAIAEAKKLGIPVIAILDTTVARITSTSQFQVMMTRHVRLIS